MLVYGMAAVHLLFLWRRGFRRHEGFGWLALALGFSFHTVAMMKRGFLLHMCPLHNLYEATVFVGWTVAAIALVLGAVPKGRFLCAFAAPLLLVTGVFALMPALDPPHGPQPDFAGGWVSLHAAMSLLAYGAFGLAAVSAAMFLMQERDLKAHKIGAVSNLLPPIQRLERVTEAMVLGGFALLTLGLMVGSHLPPPKGMVIRYWCDAKVLWSVVLWSAFLGLIWMRWRAGWGARRFALGVVGVFVFLILTFWGANLLSAIHNRS